MDSPFGLDLDWVVVSMLLAVAIASVKNPSLLFVVLSLDVIIAASVNFLFFLSRSECVTFTSSQLGRCPVSSM